MQKEHGNVLLTKDECKFRDDHFFKTVHQNPSNFCPGFSKFILGMQYTFNSFVFFFNNNLHKGVIVFLIAIYLSLVGILVGAFLGEQTMRATINFRNITFNATTETFSESPMFPGAEYIQAALWTIGGVWCGFGGICLLIFRIAELFIPEYYLRMSDRTERLSTECGEKKLTKNSPELKCVCWQCFSRENCSLSSSLRGTGILEYIIFMYSHLIVIGICILCIFIPFLSVIVGFFLLSFIHSIHNGFSASKIVLIRKGKSYCYVFKFVKNNFHFVMGIGFASFLISAIPFIGFFSGFINTVAGTRFFLSLQSIKSKKISISNKDSNLNISIISTSKKLVLSKKEIKKLENEFGNEWEKVNVSEEKEENDEFEYSYEWETVSEDE